jgi:hypothetical protein
VEVQGGRVAIICRVPRELVGVNPQEIAVGDFNGDRIQDLAVLNGAVNGSGLGSVMILAGKGDGTFSQTGPTLSTWQEPSGI